MIRNKKIPYNKPYIIGKELYYIASAVIENAQTSGDGRFTKLCHEWLEKNLNTKKALLTHSCTGALEMSAILADIQPGDEVIMPSFTFVSTANAFVLRGGIPVFVDIKKDTLNIDERLIENAISEKTKAIVPVHYAGHSCNMDVINKMAEKKNLFVIEDAAQALFSKYNGKNLGTIGHLGCLSFHETKNVISGEGGALLINDERFIERAQIIWQKGTDRKNFEAGLVDKYTWVDIGSSFLPGEIIAAFLYAQLERAEEIISKRKKLFSIYFEQLKPLEEKGYITLPHPDIEYSANGHIFYFLTKNAADRTELLSFLNNNNIKAIFHYIPLHSASVASKFSRVASSMDVTDDVSVTIVRLPLFFEMTIEEIEYVIYAIYSFYGIK